MQGILKQSDIHLPKGYRDNRSSKDYLVVFVQRPYSIARRCEDALNVDKLKQNFFTVTNSRYGLKAKKLYVCIIWHD